MTVKRTIGKRLMVSLSIVKVGDWGCEAGRKIFERSENAFSKSHLISACVLPGWSLVISVFAYPWKERLETGKAGSQWPRMRSLTGSSMSGTRKDNSPWCLSKLMLTVTDTMSCLLFTNGYNSTRKMQHKLWLANGLISYGFTPIRVGMYGADAKNAETNQEERSVWRHYGRNKMLFYFYDIKINQNLTFL